MKEINSLNPDHIISLFPGWKYKLPYNTSGRPYYDQEIYDKHSEIIEVDFSWYGKPSKAIFTRQLGYPTNFHWGIRDFGTAITIVIDNKTIDCTETTTREHYEYRDKVVTHREKINKARIKRVLTALKNNVVEKFSTDNQSPNHLVYEPKCEEWHTIYAIFDYLDGYIYCTKTRRMEEILFRHYNIHEDLLEL